MPVYQLILHPQHDAITDARRDRLLARLREAGFLGTAFELDGREHFTTGEHFLDQLSFLGCSPFIETEPPADPGARGDAARRGAFCHIHVTPALAQARFRADPQARVRCPACRQSVAAALLAQAPDTVHSCARCGHAAPVTDWNWQGNAGRSNLFIEIWGIHPGEAAPVEGFMHNLENITYCPWAFFHTRA